MKLTSFALGFSPPCLTLCGLQRQLTVKFLQHYDSYFKDTLQVTKGAFFWSYSGIGIVGTSQTIVRSRATLIPEWL